MKILFVSPRQSLPLRSGAKLREYHFLRALGQAGDVSYLYYQEPGSAPLTRTDLPFCREIVAVPKPPAYTPAKTAMGLLGKWPLPILNYTSPEMTEAVRNAMAGCEFDIIHLDSIHMIRHALEAIERRPSLQVFYNWHNIESEAMLRYSETTPSRVRAIYAKYTAKTMAALERRILREASGHIVCSEREKEELLRIAPNARIEVVENGVDTAYFADAASRDPESREIVFVGAMGYYPNAEGAVWFANDIWPEVREQMHGAALSIVGANPGPDVLTLNGLPGVKVTGMVPDVRPYYHNALAAVVPLRTGGGTRLKILEAMAAGVPVISTPLGAEGLEVASGENVILVNPQDKHGWVKAILSLADSPARQNAMVASGLALVKARYDWEILGAKLRGIYAAWLAEATTSR